MTGIVAFPRTVRALEADNFRGSIIGLLLATLLLATWTWWMAMTRAPSPQPPTPTAPQAKASVAV